MNLQDLKDKVSLMAHGMTAAEAHAKSICVKCKQPALDKCPSPAGKAEYCISGMCEECWDNMVREMLDETD